MIKKTLLASSSLCLLLLLAPVANAEDGSSGRLIIRWRGETYAPGFFEGKRLVSPKSVAVFSAAGVGSDNKPIDISKQNVFWYVNDQLVQNGTGLDEVRLSAPEVPRALFEVRAEVPDLDLIDTVEVPVVLPEAVIDAPLADRTITSASFVAHGWPFFFRSLDLSVFSFSWLVNNRPTDKNSDPHNLQVNIDPQVPRGTHVNLNLTIQNSFLSEKVSKAMTLLFNP